MNNITVITQQKIDVLIQDIPGALLKKASEELSLRYQHGVGPFLIHPEDYLVYLITRRPATGAAITQVLKKVASLDIRSMLDLGAGPGTGFLAAQAVYPQLEKVTLLEADPRFIALGKKLIDYPVHWQQAHLPCDLTKHDLVLMSYSLNEMSHLDEIVLNAYKACEKLLIIIEPGTPQGYERIIKARDLLIAQQAHILAPCPNALPCPLKDNDWCHFPARVQRSKLHRQLKGGELSYEDEKFSYLIASPKDHFTPNNRIITKPQIHKGFVEFTLCTKGQVEKKIISQKDKERYKKSRKLNWGDSLP